MGVSMGSRLIPYWPNENSIIQLAHVQAEEYAWKLSQ